MTVPSESHNPASSVRRDDPQGTEIAPEHQISMVVTELLQSHQELGVRVDETLLRLYQSVREPKLRRDLRLTLVRWVALHSGQELAASYAALTHDYGHNELPNLAMYGLVSAASNEASRVGEHQRVEASPSRGVHGLGDMNVPAILGLRPEDHPRERPREPSKVRGGDAAAIRALDRLLERRLGRCLLDFARDADEVIESTSLGFPPFLSEPGQPRVRLEAPRLLTEQRLQSMLRFALGFADHLLYGARRPTVPRVLVSDGIGAWLFDQFQDEIRNPPLDAPREMAPAVTVAPIDLSFGALDPAVAVEEVSSAPLVPDIIEFDQVERDSPSEPESAIEPYSLDDGVELSPIPASVTADHIEASSAVREVDIQRELGPIPFHFMVHLEPATITLDQGRLCVSYHKLQNFHQGRLIEHTDALLEHLREQPAAPVSLEISGPLGTSFHELTPRSDSDDAEPPLETIHEPDVEEHVLREQNGNENPQVATGLLESSSPETNVPRSDSSEAEPSPLEVHRRFMDETGPRVSIRYPPLPLVERLNLTHLDSIQRSYYFGWRAAWRRRERTSLAVSYAHVYLTEIVNLIGFEDAEASFRELMHLTQHALRQNHVRGSVAHDRVLGFVAHHDLDGRARDLLWEYFDANRADRLLDPERVALWLMQPDAERLRNPFLFTALTRLDHRNGPKRPLPPGTSDRTAALVAGVMAAVNEFERERGETLRAHFLQRPPVLMTSSEALMRDFVLETPPHPNGFSLLRPHPAALSQLQRFLAEVAKYTENLWRGMSGIPGQLPLRKAHDLSASVQAAIQDAVKKTAGKGADSPIPTRTLRRQVLQNPPSINPHRFGPRLPVRPPEHKIEIDHQALASIERESEAVRARLGETEPGADVSSASSSRPVTASATNELGPTIPWLLAFQGFRSPTRSERAKASDPPAEASVDSANGGPDEVVVALAEVEREYLEVLVRGDQSQARKMLQKLSLMPSTLVERINERAVELMGDVLIEMNGEKPVVVDEYLADLRLALGVE
jgi:hypothetical protein